MKKPIHWKETRCKKCGSSQNLTRDHIVPKWFTDIVLPNFGFRIKGGSVRLRNSGIKLPKYQTLCARCNFDKSGLIEYSHPLVRAYLKVFVENILDIIDIHEK